MVFIFFCEHGIWEGQIEIRIEEGGRRRRKKEPWGIKGWRTERENGGRKGNENKGDTEEEMRGNQMMRVKQRWGQSVREELRWFIFCERQTGSNCLVGVCHKKKATSVKSQWCTIDMCGHSESLSHYNQSVKPFLRCLLSFCKYDKTTFLFSKSSLIISVRCSGLKEACFRWCLIICQQYKMF